MAKPISSFFEEIREDEGLTSKERMIVRGEIAHGETRASWEVTVCIIHVTRKSPLYLLFRDRVPCISDWLLCI